MDQPKNYVLVIGIDDYSALDRAANEAAGSSNLVGARNDARCWYRYCAAVGIPPTHMRLLTSPQLREDELDLSHAPDRLAEATGDEITAGLDWLVAALAQSAQAVGSIVFVGRGQPSGAIELLPADAANATSAIRVAERLHARAGQAVPQVVEDVAGRLVVLLDCARSGPASDSEGTLFGLRVLASDRRNGSTLTVDDRGQPVGTFSWAVRSQLARALWTRRGDVLRPEISYARLHAGANDLLSALGVPQRARLLAPSETAESLADSVVFAPPATAREIEPGKYPPQLDPAEGQSHRSYTILVRGADMDWCPLALIWVNPVGSQDDCATAVIRPCPQRTWCIPMPRGEESWNMHENALLELDARSFTHLRIVAGAGDLYGHVDGTDGYDLRSFDYRVTAAEQSPWSRISDQATYPADGLTFVLPGAPDQANIPTALSIERGAQGSWAVSKVAWYQQGTKMLFEGVADGAHFDYVRASADQRPAAGWHTASSAMTSANGVWYVECEGGAPVSLAPPCNQSARG